MNDRIVITGVGIVDNLGTSPMECFENMLSEEYIDPVEFETEIESLKVEVFQDFCSRIQYSRRHPQTDAQFSYCGF